MATVVPVRRGTARGGPERESTPHFLEEGAGGRDGKRGGKYGGEDAYQEGRGEGHEDCQVRERQGKEVRTQEEGFRKWQERRPVSWPRVRHEEGVHIES